MPVKIIYQRRRGSSYRAGFSINFLQPLAHSLAGHYQDGYLIVRTETLDGFFNHRVEVSFQKRGFFSRERPVVDYEEGKKPGAIARDCFFVIDDHSVEDVVRKFFSEVKWDHSRFHEVSYPI